MMPATERRRLVVEERFGIVRKFKARSQRKESSLTMGTAKW